MCVCVIEEMSHLNRNVDNIRIRKYYLESSIYTKLVYFRHG